MFYTENGYMSLVTTHTGDTQSSAEIDTAKNIMYGSFRVTAQVLSPAGAVAGIFTYADDSNEADIEMLTDESTHTIQFVSLLYKAARGNRVY